VVENWVLGGLDWSADRRCRHPPLDL